jgi:hypothetical protein
MSINKAKRNLVVLMQVRKDYELGSAGRSARRAAEPENVP